MKRLLGLLAVALLVAAACREAPTSPASSDTFKRFGGPRSGLFEACDSARWQITGMPFTDQFTGRATVTGPGATGAPLKTGDVALPGSSIEFCVPIEGPMTLTVVRSDATISYDGHGSHHPVGSDTLVVIFDATASLPSWTVTFGKGVNPTSSPTDKSQCMKGGWSQFGFKNQGQCVRFIETGKDSR